MRLFLAACRSFARKLTQKPACDDLSHISGTKHDPELMAIVKKHIGANLAVGKSPDEIIRSSFGPEVMRKVPDDPNKLQGNANSGLNLKDVKMQISPELQRDLSALKARRERVAKPAAETAAPPIKFTEKVDLPHGYKKSDIEKRIEKLRQKDARKNSS